MRTISFTTIGLPAPQGSKNRFGGEGNPRVKPYREAIAADAAAAIGADAMFNGPVHVSVVFCFPRPKSHYRTGRHSHELRDDAPFSISTKPDLDKLCRAVGDAITGIIIRDDAQISAWTASKIYDTPARTLVTITERDNGIF